MKKIIFVVLSVILIAGCTKDYLEINKDPNNPTVAPNKLLLPGIQVELGRWLSMGDGLGSIATVYSHQGTTREHWNDYGVLGTSFYNQQNWFRLYRMLSNVELLINQGEENDELLYAGVAKLLKAYTYSIMVDVWGDVPYSDAIDLGKNPTPSFDKGEDIYRDLFLLIDDAIADLNNNEAANILRPGGEDIMYGGSIDKWIRFANTLKLKLYIQVRETDMWNATAVNALLSSGKLIENHDQGMMVSFGTSNAPENRHPAFVQEYEGGQIGFYISPWFYQIMMGMNASIFTGIEDPRVPYYFYNQLMADEEPQNPFEYIHDSQYGRFLSVWFGSIGPNRDSDQRISATMLGIYPAGGRYSNPDDTDDDRVQGRGSSATGAVPQRILTYADRLYLEAELVQLGLTTGNIEELLRKAMEESFRQVDFTIANAVHSSQEGKVPSLDPDNNEDVADYISSIMNAFGSADDERKLEIIMTQKWISSMGSPIDQYTDYRRTGFPVLHDPNSDENPDTQSLRNYALSFPWSNEELTLNPNAPEQKNPGNFRVFWDVQ
jgi:hypothetical protein